MSAANQIFPVMDTGSPKAAFTTGRELQAYLRRRLDTFINPLVYTFWGNQGPSIMTMSSGAGGVKARCVLTNITDLARVGAREWESHAP
jgi:hypothetical protein